ncbi:hypothetical protein SUGI_0895660 [Cryptomeria japonica]|nr:hypothetical protein SUGI_0895660 [Cryptomeria japonica]
MVHYYHFNGTLNASDSTGNAYALAAGCVVFIMVAIALVLLLWPCCKQDSINETAQSFEYGQRKNEVTYSCKDQKESVLVVMPGDENPTFIAQILSLKGEEHTVNIIS